MEIFNNPLIYFVIIPLLTLLGLAFCNNRGMRAIRAVAVTGAVALVALAIYLVCLFLQARAAGDTSEMILQSKVMWYAPFNIELALGVDGVSVVAVGFHRVCRRVRLVEDESPAQAILLVVLPVVDRCVRFLHLNRPVHHVHVL